MGKTGAFIRADEVFHGQLGAAGTVALDEAHGNVDMLRGVAALGMAGPFGAAGPWELEDERGVRRLHACGFGAVPFGERPPELVEFLRQYLETGRNIGMPQQFASEWRAALAHNLVQLLARFAPSHADSAVVLSNSGSEAIEAAVKLVRGFRPNSPHLLNFTSAYHGMTWMALSLTPTPAYQDPFQPLVPGVVTVPYANAEALADTITRLGPDKIAGIVVEPIQGAGGVIIPPAGYLRALGELCRRHGIPIVADEVQVGLGRAGHWFASLAQELEPDVVCVGKALSGGLVPTGATIARRSIFRKAFGGMHGCQRHFTTYSGNALAAAVGLKALELLVEGDLPERSRRLGEVGLERLRAIQARYPDLLAEVRGSGLLFALRFQPVLSAGWLKNKADLIGEFTGLLAWRTLYRAGVAANPPDSACTVRLTPPLNMPEDLLDELWRRVDRAAGANPSAGRMLVHTDLGAYLRLANIARSG
jgi:acetylornithine/succinyldiaminopimelate/putrescine aminotransferase